MATRPLDLMESEEPEAFDEQDLVAILKREFEAADSEYDHMRKVIINAHNYYEAKPFGNEVDGRSQIVLPDVQETIDYMSVSVLRTFVSGDKVVEFEATDEADEQYTDEATAAIGYNFMRQQDGYRILHDWCVSGLLERAGIAKTMVETQEKVSRENIVISDPVELEGFDGEIEGTEENEDGTWTVSTKRTARQKRFTDVAVPFGEFRFSPNARHEDDADYLAHCPIKTRSELVDMGFDRDQVYGLPAYTKLPDETRENWWDHAESSPALQEILLCEEYARIDIDGDGIAERVKVCRVENEILRYAVPYANGGELAIETVDDQPFTVFCPFPRAHRLIGWSLADKVMDIQLGRSTIARQLFDGMYNANMPRPIVDETQLGENTIDDLLSPIAGSPIRVRGGAASVQPYQTGFDVGKSMTVLEWMTGERESRTGITRLNQGLDADALNKTATGTALMQAQGQQQEEFIARNLAEALSRLMAKKYRLMRVEGEPFRVRVDGKYKMVDPRKWPEEMNVTIRVGLGTGSKDKRIQGRMALAPFLAEGFQNKQVTPKHLFNAVDGLVRDLGLGQGDDFWVDPDAPPEIDPATGQPVEEPDEGPSPEQIEAQGKVQAEQQKIQLEAMKSEATLTLSREESAAKIELMREEGAQKLQLEREKAEFEAQLARDQQMFEMQMAERQFAAEQAQAERRMELEARNAEHRASMAQSESEARISKKRPGGDLDK
jgi:hypothetical protein